MDVYLIMAIVHDEWIPIVCFRTEKEAIEYADRGNKFFKHLYHHFEKHFGMLSREQVFDNVISESQAIWGDISELGAIMREAFIDGTIVKYEKITLSCRI
jgi:hypothetical protein